MNNRDHRKITVVDGRVGFTGGYNLAEEYFNRTHPYGQWKDSGIRLEGDAVRGLTLIFLELWGATQKAAPEVERYLPDVPYTARENAVVLPYADNPLDDEATGGTHFSLVLAGAYKMEFGDAENTSASRSTTARSCRY